MKNNSGAKKLGFGDQYNIFEKLFLFIIYLFFFIALTKGFLVIANSPNFLFSWVEQINLCTNK